MRSIILSFIKKLDTSQTANPNASYNVILEVIETARKKHTTGKFVKFNKSKHKKSKWITYGILKSIIFRDNLYIKIEINEPGTEGTRHTLQKSSNI